MRITLVCVLLLLIFVVFSVTSICFPLNLLFFHEKKIECRMFYEIQ